MMSSNKSIHIINDKFTDPCRMTISPKPSNLVESAKSYWESMNKKNMLHKRFVESLVSCYGICNCSWKPQIVSGTRINSRSPPTFTESSYIRRIRNNYLYSPFKESATKLMCRQILPYPTTIVEDHA